MMPTNFIRVKSLSESTIYLYPTASFTIFTQFSRIKHSNYERVMIFFRVFFLKNQMD